MAVNNKTELLEALNAHKYDDILGTAECSWLDFKQAGYQTEPSKPQKLSDYGKTELCKDIAEFANHKGGVILLGVKEAKSPTTGLSVADEIKPLAVTSIDLQHYKQVLMAQVYPLVEDVEMKWFAKQDGRGLLAIIVPKSNDILHILRQVYDTDGHRIRGLEIPVRADDQTYLYTAESLSERINKRTRSEDSSLSRSSFGKPIPYEAMKNFHDNIKNQHKQIAQDGKFIRDQLLEMNDWTDSPVYILQAIPYAGKDRLDGFYDSIKEAFAHTKPVRRMGFNLNSLGRETNTVEGAFVKAGIREGAIRLDPNGTLTMALVASESFLGWGVNNSLPKTFNKINSIVLIETVFEFTKFVEEILKPAGLTTWRYCIDIRNFKKNNVALYPGSPGNLWDEDIQSASKDTYEKQITDIGDYESATYKILTEIYALFALPESAIPYTAEKKVTEEKLISISVDGR